MLLITALVWATGVSACQKDNLLGKRHSNRKPITKRNTEWPPVLTKEETILVNAFDNVTLDEWSDYYGHQNKLAGYGHEAAQWTADRWNEHGFESHLQEYHVYLSYPVSNSLSISYANGSKEEVNLVETALAEDEVTGRDDATPTFHGYSASGKVSAEYFYAG